MPQGMLSKSQRRMVCGKLNMWRRKPMPAALLSRIGTHDIDGARKLTLLSNVRLYGSVLFSLRRGPGRPPFPRSGSPPNPPPPEAPDPEAGVFGVGAGTR